MHLVEDTVELPDGATISYLRHAPTDDYAVCAIAVNDKQEMLCQREYSHPPGAVLWQLPGGGGAAGEDILVAANRELSEESGFVGRRCTLLGSYYMDNRRSDMVQHVVLCTDIEERPGTCDPEEFIESYWVPVDEVRRRIRDGSFNSAFLLAALTLYFSHVEHPPAVGESEQPQ